MKRYTTQAIFDRTAGGWVCTLWLSPVTSSQLARGGCVSGVSMGHGMISVIRAYLDARRTARRKIAAQEYPFNTP